MLPTEILDCIQRALAEDIGTGDATTLSIVPIGSMMKGQIIAKQEGVIAGLDVARAAYELLDSTVDFRIAAQMADGSRVARGGILALASGRTSSLLTAERTALNFLGRMSGIATLTRQFVDAVAGTRAIILDTRKTAPGLRLVDKLAVKLGGGGNHRIGLYDMILIKDNHIDYAGGIEEAVRRARAFDSGLPIEVETRTLDDVKVVLDLGVERILLDNMSVKMMAKAVRMRDDFVGAGHVPPLLEASGNVTLETVRAIAETGVDFISVGALTHSAKVFDVSFDYVK